MEEYKKIITDLVESNPGIKGPDLIVQCITKMHEQGNLESHGDVDIINVINDLVKEGEVVEVEYVLPSMAYRVKSLYFPKGTEVTLVRSTKLIN